MPRRKRVAHLFELAKRGAEVRLRELAEEAENVIDLLPHFPRLVTTGTNYRCRSSSGETPVP